MPKKKATIKIAATCDKCRSKALKVASNFVPEEILLQGEHSDLLVIIGDGFDVVDMVVKLRKKLCCGADLLKLEEVKPEAKKDEPKKEDKKEEKKEEGCKCGAKICYCGDPRYIFPPQYLYVCDDPCSSRTGFCSFM